MTSEIGLPPLTEADIQAIRRVHYSSSLYAFVEAAWPILEPATDFIHSWHLKSLCAHLEAVSRGEITRLAISIPPGFMKSGLVSVLWPAWEWTHSPHIRWLTSSSSEQFCERDNGKMRLLVGSEWYQALWPIDFPHVDTVLRFVNNSMGERLGKSWSSLTGVRGNRLVLDDLLPVDSANSEVDRGKVSRRFFESATSRLYKESDAIVVIMQRVHELDLIGEIKDRQQSGDDLGFQFIEIPMEYEGAERISTVPEDIIPREFLLDPRTELGQPILPEYRSQKWIDREKATMGSYAWNAQYQQQPTPRGNGFFQTDDFRFYNPNKSIAGKEETTLPDRLNYYLTSDHALGVSKTGGDYNVFRIWAVDVDKNFWLVDSFRERCTIQRAIGVQVKDGRFEVMPTGAFALIRKYKPLVWYADADNIIKAQQEFVSTAMIETGVWVRRELISQGRTSKIERASSLQSAAQLGKVFLPNNSIGRNALDEYEAFGPGARHDDQVDADGLLMRQPSLPAVRDRPAAAKRDRGYVVSGESDEISDAHACF